MGKLPQILRKTTQILVPVTKAVLCIQIQIHIHCIPYLNGPEFPSLSSQQKIFSQNQCPQILLRRGEVEQNPSPGKEAQRHAV